MRATPSLRPGAAVTLLAVAAAVFLVASPAWGAETVWPIDVNANGKHLRNLGAPGAGTDALRLSDVAIGACTLAATGVNGTIGCAGLLGTIATIVPPLSLSGSSLSLLMDGTSVGISGGVLSRLSLTGAITSATGSGTTVFGTQVGPSLFGVAGSSTAVPAPIVALTPLSVPMLNSGGTAIVWTAVTSLFTPDAPLVFGGSGGTHLQLTLGAGLHLATSALAVDLSTGKSGGQTAFGGTGAGEAITLQGTTHATPGPVKVVVGTSAGQGLRLLRASDGLEAGEFTTYLGGSAGPLGLRLDAIFSAPMVSTGTLVNNDGQLVIVSSLDGPIGSLGITVGSAFGNGDATGYQFAIVPGATQLSNPFGVFTDGGALAFGLTPVGAANFLGPMTVGSLVGPGFVKASSGGLFSVDTTIYAPSTRTVQGTTPIDIAGDNAAHDLSVNRVWSLHANGVANSFLAQMVADTIKGNNTGSTANAADLTPAQVTAMLNQFTSSLQGLVSASGGGTVNYLRADNTWGPPAGTAGITALTGDGTATGPGPVPFTLHNIPNLTTMAASVLATEVTGASTPASGKVDIHAESSTDTLWVTDSAGRVTTTARPVSLILHNVLTSMSSDGTFSQTQLSYGDVAGSIPAITSLTGPVTGTGPGATATAINLAGGSIANTLPSANIGAATVAYSKLQNETGSTLLGNPTGSAAAPSEITLGAGLSFSGTTLTATGSGGTVVSVSGTATRISSTGGTTPVIDLINTAVTPGSYTYGGFTVGNDGRLTAAASGTAPVTSVSGTSGQINSSGGTTPILSLPNVGPGATTTGSAGIASITTDAQGRFVSAATATYLTTASAAATYQPLETIQTCFFANTFVSSISAAGVTTCTAPTIWSGLPSAADVLISAGASSTPTGDSNFTYNTSTHTLTSGGANALSQTSLSGTTTLTTLAGAATFLVMDISGHVQAGNVGAGLAYSSGTLSATGSISIDYTTTLIANGPSTPAGWLVTSSLIPDIGQIGQVYEYPKQFAAATATLKVVVIHNNWDGSGDVAINITRNGSTIGSTVHILTTTAPGTVLTIGPVSVSGGSISDTYGVEWQGSGTVTNGRQIDAASTLVLQ